MSDAPVRLPHPIRFFFLFLPVGVGFAYVSVSLGWEAEQAKLADGVIAGFALACLLPHTWKFLWAPAVDTLGSPRAWYVGANAFTCASLAAVALVPVDPGHAGQLRGLAFAVGLATTGVGMSTEWLMAHLTAEAKGGAAAWWHPGRPHAVPGG